MDRCALPTSWLDCFKSDNKNETISRRLRDPAAWRTRRGETNGTRAEEAFPANATSSSNFCPAYASVVLCPHQNSPRERGKLPTVGVLRLPTDVANVRLAQVAMETDEKRRPGLFETIIRRSIPLVLVLCISLAAVPPPDALQSFLLNKNVPSREKILDPPTFLRLQFVFHPVAASKSKG